MSKTLEDLLEIINDNESFYESVYVTYANISFDKKCLAKLLYELKHLKETDEWIEKQKVLISVLEQNDVNHLYKLLTDDPEVERWATIEKLSRRAATEYMCLGQYEIDTFNMISNLPLEDYKMVMIRIEEIVSNFSNINKQTNKTINGLAGND